MTTFTAENRMRATAPAIPGPRPMPILGWRGNAIPIFRDPLVQMLRLQQRYGDIVALAAGHSAYIMAFAPAYNHQFLTDPGLYHSFDVTDPAAPAHLSPNTAAARIMSGVAGMNGPQHIQHRRFLMPAFHRKRVDGLLDTVVARTEQRLAAWRPGQTRDLKHEMIELTMDVAISALLGLDPHTDGRPVRAVMEDWTHTGLSIPVVMLQWDLPGLPYARFLRQSARLEAALQQVIATKRARGVDSGDALSMLLQAHDEEGGTLTDIELLGDLTTLFFAGHDTSASTLTWTLFLLSQHPRVMAALLDELTGVLRGAAPTIEQLGALPLLEWVINESMRLFPAALWLWRTATAEFELGPYVLPAGTHVVFSPAVTHRDPAIYPAPHRFRPERWASLEPSPYEYLPFGGGPRRCLGATFAVMEMKVVLALILQRFRLTVPLGTRVDRSGMLLSFPRRAVPVVLHTQDGQFPAAHVQGTIHDVLALDPAL